MVGGANELDGARIRARMTVRCEKLYVATSETAFDLLGQREQRLGVNSSWFSGVI